MAMIHRCLYLLTFVDFIKQSAGCSKFQNKGQGVLWSGFVGLEGGDAFL